MPFGTSNFWSCSIADDCTFTYLEAIGFRDREKKIPMSTDAIFQIASMTKPFTSVATIMLVEEGNAAPCRF
jgi:CubicO group peptidase (beta-lactamase class C family)